MKNKKALAILGGMGPGASNYMYKTLIDLSIEYFGAVNNEDFPEIILHSIPVPDFIAETDNKDSALKMLKQRVKDLNKLNVANISIACNTAHLLLDDLQGVSRAPFVSMLDEVVLTVKKDNLRKVGILGSPTTIKSELYQKKFKEFEIDVVSPTNTQLTSLEKIIRNVINGYISKKDGKILKAIANSLYTKGVKGIVLGCTELPLVFPGEYKKVKVYNSVEILSLALLQKYYK